MSIEKDLSRYLREPEETVVGRFGNNAEVLRQNGRQHFLLPGCLIGGFCVCAGILLRVAQKTRPASSVLLALGIGLIAAATLFHAVFLREARRAAGYSLILTTKGVCCISGASYFRVPLASLTDVGIAHGDRLRHFPFDMSALERTFLVFRTEGDGEDALLFPYLRDPETVQNRILAQKNAAAS